ncbi:MAG: class I SAM-dependent methyltransferase [Dehalococcoidia bacterium]|nr:class I SAM-dependent methyltransferase [Dehalococcoidia bacterium]
MSERWPWREYNRAFWDERVPLHLRSEFYGLDRFKGGYDPIANRPFEIAEMGDVKGKSLLHLQCHFGMDTLAWARRGAEVTGLDFSAPAVEAARELARELGLSGRFVVSDVYGAEAALDGRQFDIVYTGRGALVWLPDVPRWARVAASLVKPGGFLYLSEFHPFHEVFADEDLTLRYDYFDREPRIFEESGSYAAEGATTQNTTYEWAHGLGEVVTSIIEAGLRLEFLHEFEYTGWKRWPFMEKTGNEVYRMPEGMPLVPLSYSLKASKPA